MDVDTPSVTAKWMDGLLSARHADGSNVHVSMTLAPSPSAMNATITHAAVSSALNAHPSAMKRVNAPSAIPLKQIPLKNRKQENKTKRIKEQKPKKALAFLFPYTNTLANTLVKKLKRITAPNVGGYKA